MLPVWAATQLWMGWSFARSDVGILSRRRLSLSSLKTETLCRAVRQAVLVAVQLYLATSRAYPALHGCRALRSCLGKIVVVLVMYAPCVCRQPTHKEHIASRVFCAHGPCV